MTAILQQPCSRSSNPSAKPARAPFPPVSTPVHPHHNAIVPPSLFTSNFAEPELPTHMPLAIPELWSFDQEELNDNPVLNELCPIPLIGGMLLARQLVTREQIDECLLLQAQMYPDLPIGQILVRRGYISQMALDHTLGIQADMRSSLNDTDHA